MIKVRKKQAQDDNINVCCEYGKLMAIFKLSNEELIDIIQMKSKKDLDSIKQFLLQQDELCLHPANFEILNNDTEPVCIPRSIKIKKQCELLVYAPHAYKSNTIIAALVGNYLFEFVPRFGCKKFFIGGVSHKPFVISGLENVKPVKLYIE